jgi:hypothetical protein
MAQMYTNEWHEHLYTHSPCVDLQAYTSGRHVEGQNYFYTGRGTFCTPLLPDLTDSFILFLTYLNRLLLGEDTHLAFGRRRDTSLLASVAEPVKLFELAPSCHGQEGELSPLIHTSARRHFGHWDSFFPSLVLAFGLASVADAREVLAPQTKQHIRLPSCYWSRSQQ